MFAENLLLSNDSYKDSHSLQYPGHVQGMCSYIEARRNTGPYQDIKGTVFFGLQAMIKEYLLKPITADDIEEAAEITQLHGTPFPKDQFYRVLKEYRGRLPLTIRAVKEGTHVPFGNALVDVTCVTKDLFWLASWIETQLLRGVWYPTTVCTNSNYIKQIIRHFLEETSDDPIGQLPFKLHDFGARGASSGESAGLGGIAHLVNFRGTDTKEALVAGRRYYASPISGFSIPAAEHSTITAWGREFEVDAYRNMINQFSRPGSAYAVVADSYNIYDAVSNLFGDTLKDEVIRAGGMLIVRPDSGDPVTVCLAVIARLADKFGTTTNSKGYRVLNNVRVIQGDGVDPFIIKSILNALKINGFSAENIAFGMGGALLQKVDRDTFSFAQKCCAVYDTRSKTWIDVYKDPIAGGKTSKRGVQSLIRGTIQVLEHGVYTNKESLVTCRSEELLASDEDLLEPVYSYGDLLRDQSLDEIRVISEETEL